MAAASEETRLGERVRAERRRLGLTQDELARRSAVKLDTLRAIEQGRTRNPGVFTIARLAAHLDVTLDALVEVRRPDRGSGGAGSGLGGGGT